MIQTERDQGGTNQGDQEGMSQKVQRDQVGMTLKNQGGQVDQEGMIQVGLVDRVLHLKKELQNQSHLQEKKLP